MVLQTISEEQKPIEGLLGPARGYIDILDEAIVAAKLKEQSQPVKYHPLRPSSSGYCARRLAYDYNAFKGNATYAPEPPDPDLERIFALGHSVEYAFIKSLERVEAFQVKYKQQVLSFGKISEDTILEGSNDFCLYFEKWRSVSDVKSKKSRFSSWANSSWEEIGDKLGKMKSVQVVNERVFWVNDLDAFLGELDDPFFADNFLQLNLYATSDFLRERGVDHAWIAQYDKNGSQLREVRFRPSLKARDYVLEKFKNITFAIDSGAGPEAVEREYSLGSLRCAYCPRKQYCWPADDAKKLYFSTWPKKKWPTDTHRLEEVGEELEDLYQQYLDNKSNIVNENAIEEKIIMTMRAADVDKVRFSDGSIYEMKHLKDRIAFRRGKL